jgi:hypothetical protein
MDFRLSIGITVNYFIVRHAYEPDSQKSILIFDQYARFQEKRSDGNNAACATAFPIQSERTAGSGRAWRRKASASPGLPVIRSWRHPFMPRTPDAFDFRKPIAHDAVAKRAFHTAAQRQLRRLAHALGLTRSQYDLLLNAGYIGGSGEVTLRSDRLYVQVSQPAARANTDILFRTCHGRKDFAEGENHYASLELLNQPEQLARLIRQVCDV